MLSQNIRDGLSFRPPVRLSVTTQYCVKTTKHVVEIPSQYGSPSFWSSESIGVTNSNGITPKGNKGT